MIQRFIELLSMKISRDFSQSALVRLHHSHYVVARGKRIRGSLSMQIKQMIKTNNRKKTKRNSSFKLLYVVSQEATHWPKFRNFVLQKIVGISVLKYTMS